DHVQSRPVQGASLTQSARGLASSDYAFRDSTCRRFPRLFLPKRGLDSTKRLAVRTSVLKRDAPAYPTAGQSRCQRLCPVIADMPRSRKSRHTVQLAAFPSAVSILSEDPAPPRNPDEHYQDEATKRKQACRDGTP